MPQRSRSPAGSWAPHCLAAPASPSSCSLGSHSASFTSNLPLGAILRLYQTDLQSWPQTASSGPLEMLQSSHIIQLRAHREAVKETHAGSSPLHEFWWQQGSQKCTMPGHPFQGWNHFSGTSKTHVLEVGCLFLQKRNVTSACIFSSKQSQNFLTLPCKLTSTFFPCHTRPDLPKQFLPPYTIGQGDITYGSTFCHLPEPTGSARASQASRGETKSKQTKGQETHTENKGRQAVSSTETSHQAAATEHLAVYEALAVWYPQTLGPLKPPGAQIPWAWVLLPSPLPGYWKRRSEKHWERKAPQLPSARACAEHVHGE